MKYDQIYRTKNVWGTEPNNLLLKIYSEALAGCHFLDLGCGQGRDSFFMLSKGFNVTAVDNSEEGIRDMREFLWKNNLSDAPIDILCEDIKEFKIQKDKYEIINAYNALQFLFKKDALHLIEEIKEKIKNKGYVIISGFTIDDQSFMNPGNKDRCFFQPEELRTLFSDFLTIYYEEFAKEDEAHSGMPEPHKHSVVKMIAQKNFKIN